MSLALEDCKVYISSVDSQSSAEGGIVVQVIGEMSNRGGAWRKFAQTFFLAEQPNGYFVLNDICRYLKEEGEEDEPIVDTKHSGPVEAVLFDEPPTEEFRISDSAVPTIATKSVETPIPSQASTSSQPSAAVTNGSHLHDSTPDLASDSPSPEPISAPVPDAIPVPTTPAVAEPLSSTAPAPIETPIEAAEPIVVAEEPVAAPQPEPSPPAPIVKAVPAPVVASVTPSPKESITPPVPAVPVVKSWATLAASNKTGWGSTAINKAGVSMGAPPVSVASTSTSTQSSSTPTPPARTPYHPSVMAVTLLGCFVKGVVESVNENTLREIIVQRYGPLREFDVIRSKACAFIEFEKLDGARRAIQASMRVQDGGEGGLYITPEGSNTPDLLHIVTRKALGDRPAKVAGAAEGRAGANRGGNGGAAGPGAGPVRNGGAAGAAATNGSNQKSGAAANGEEGTRTGKAASKGRGGKVAKPKAP